MMCWFGRFNEFFRCVPFERVAFPSRDLMNFFRFTEKRCIRSPKEILDNRRHRMSARGDIRCLDSKATPTPRLEATPNARHRETNQLHSKDSMNFYCRVPFERVAFPSRDLMDFFRFTEKRCIRSPKGVVFYDVQTRETHLSQNERRHRMPAVGVIRCLDWYEMPPNQRRHRMSAAGIISCLDQ